LWSLSACVENSQLPFCFLSVSPRSRFVSSHSANNPSWCEQIIDFLETIVLPSSAAAAAATSTAPKKVHLVGNSLGGHLAAHVAVRRPDLVASLCLLNPTPVWGSKLPGWNGHLPAPGKQKTSSRSNLIEPSRI
jgi:pimeloyl-ACP methyl ester carboxylesterase